MMDHCRRAHPWIWRTALAAFFGTTATLLRKYVPLGQGARSLLFVDQIGLLFQRHWTIAPLLTAVGSSVATLVFSSFMFPLLAYLPFTIAHKDLGIVAASMDPIIASWMQEAARRTTLTHSDRVKVVCEWRDGNFVGGKCQDVFRLS
jgi:hypothetical protein